MMNILFIVPYVPNLVRTRPYNLIRHLSKRGNRVTVLTVWTNEQERAELENLKHECHFLHAMSMPVWRSFWNCIMALPSGVPLQSVFSWRPELVASLDGNGSFDVAHVEHLRGSRYGLFLKHQNNMPVVWDSVDCITHLFRQASVQSKSLIGRLRTRFELERTEKYEGWLVNKFDRVLVTSRADKQALEKLNSNGSDPAPISVLENGVDLSYFNPDTTFDREPATLVVSGKMNYHANVTMVINLVENIMPKVWSHRSDVKLWIVGKDPTREIQALARNTAITVTGTVDDIRPYLNRATLAVTPIAYGAGIQNKVLEAMACATPVITTPQAISAIDVVPGEDVLVAEDPSRFAQNIIDLLDNPSHQEELGQNGLAFVRANHHWADIAAKLEDIYIKAKYSKSQAAHIN